jgi:hypothetical protein
VQRHHARLLPVAPVVGPLPLSCVEVVDAGAAVLQLLWGTTGGVVKYARV